MVLHGAAGRAPTRLNRGGDVCRGSWRHGLLRGEHADEDQPPLTVRTHPRLDRRHRLHGGWYERWSGRAVLYQVGLRRRLQLQHLPYPGGVPALRGMPQAEVTDFVEAARQHMLEEAAHKLVAAETTGMSAAGLAVLVLDRDRLVVEADDPGVGESDTEDVAGEVVEHRLFAIAPGADVKHPAVAPDRVRDDEIRALPLWQRPELTPHQSGESCNGNQELAARRMPGGAVLGDPATTDQTMNMRVEGQLLCPGMQHGEHGDGAADVTWIAGEVDDRGGGGLHQHGVAVALMSAQHLTQFSRNSNGDVEIRHRQHLRLTAFEPFLRLGGVALGTASVATGVEREHLGGACIAAPHLAAERRGAAVEDVLDGTPMRWQHRRAVISAADAPGPVAQDERGSLVPLWVQVEQ